MRFSRVILSLCVIATVNGCALFIPPEQNAPRNNTVLGGPRRPQLNINHAPQSALPQAADAATLASAGTPAPALPPVDPTVKAKAEEALAANTTPPAPTAAATPVAVAAASNPLGERRVPVENAQFQVAGNYPALDSVPPRPQLTGPDSAASRLSATQEELERSRADATKQAETLGRDAAAEPSLLNELPKTNNPAPALAPQPVPSSNEIRRAPTGNGAAAEPVTNAAPVAASSEPAPRIMLPVVANNAPPALPSGPTFAPPPPVGPLASVNVGAPPAVRAVAAPAATASVAPARAPITLRPPVPYEPTGEAVTAAAAQAPVVAATAPARGPNVRPGDFDPLATSDNAPIANTGTAARLPSLTPVINSSYATNSRMLAPSRYYERR